ncbi:conserved Plasmodium protein, unknown function [Plasmodium malariae]|uniref:Uncharacterized protein n=1 Tax=Plasmodium malariae TaxID=5858 RepID=A0A1A8WMF4_PLAMA|nr:conserved Plasmodium protein, unknown function [Plasmodium malariae]SBS92502.1 conserved Plasmodium protein, unknown function [Plasmodium malariae]SCP03476.1 conserved Plasmodium protein, unknown function [Plasmodium malariae]
MHKNKKTSVIVSKKLQEKVIEGKKYDSKIHNDVMKLINNEIVLDYSTNQKVNSKYILNKYLSIITRLMKENLNLKKKIETIKLENGRKDDTIIKYENELRKKNDIINKLPNKLGIHMLNKNINVYDNAKTDEVNTTFTEYNNIQKIGDDNTGNIIITENSSTDKELNQNEVSSHIYLNNNFVCENKMAQNNPVINHIGNNTIIQNEVNFLKKKAEKESSLLKRENSFENKIGTAYIHGEKINYNNKYTDVNKHDVINTQKMYVLNEMKTSTNTSDTENISLGNKKTKRKEKPMFVNNGSSFFLNKMNTSNYNDKCIEEFNYLLNVANTGNVSSMDRVSFVDKVSSMDGVGSIDKVSSMNGVGSIDKVSSMNRVRSVDDIEYDQQFENIRKLEKYVKNCEEEYKNILSKNSFIGKQSSSSNIVQRESNVSKHVIDEKRNLLNSLEIYDNLSEPNNINVTRNSSEQGEKKKENDKRNGNKNDALINRQITQVDYKEEKKQGDEGDFNICHRNKKSLYISISDETDKDNIYTINKSNLTVLYNKNDKIPNNDLHGDNNSCDNYNLTHLNSSEKRNTNDLEDENYEDLENIMSTILKLRKKG